MSIELHIGLLGAMSQEIGADLNHLQNLRKFVFGDLIIYQGIWRENVKITLAWSGWGKVAAARAATRIVATAPDIDLLLFTGVAGSADLSLNQWDVLVADSVVQHDMNASPLFPRFTLPALQSDRIIPPKSWLIWAKESLEKAYISGELENFGKPCSGLIATGDQFIDDILILEELCDALPNLKAVEMEGAAVAQVAAQEGVPWLILRVISDNADKTASLNFIDFINIYEKSAWSLIETLLKRQHLKPKK